MLRESGTLVAHRGNRAKWGLTPFFHAIFPRWLGLSATGSRSIFALSSVDQVS